MTYTINGVKNETFTIEGTDNLEGLDNLKKELIKSGKEPVQYLMRRVVAGTRKKDYTVPCWRFNSGGFVKMF